MTQSISWLTEHLAKMLGTEQFIVYATISIVLVSLICGAVGAMVVGNRMAFFSDALGHCAIAGISMGLLLTVRFQLGDPNTLIGTFTLFIMVSFGMLIGVGIAYVREKTALASDTVIGVFFAGALGLGAVLFSLLKHVNARLDPDMFLFGSPTFVQPVDLLRLLALLVLTAVIIGWRYNQLVFASFNPSLARSRRIPLRLYNYMFILLLALIVNVCLLAVGALLINAMLIVPAATANNLSRNLRQMFWWTIGLSLFSGLGGQWASTVLEFRVVGKGTSLGTSGCIVILSVLCFGSSLAAGRWLKGRQSR